MHLNAIPRIGVDAAVPRRRATVAPLSRRRAGVRSASAAKPEPAKPEPTKPEPTKPEPAAKVVQAELTSDLAGSDDEGDVDFNPAVEGALLAKKVTNLLNPQAREVKAALLDSLYGTERGLAARSEIRAEINELVTSLEGLASLPTLEDLNGTWKLLYTSNPGTLAILALSKLPLVTVADFLEIVDSTKFTIVDSVDVSVPLSKTTLSTEAKFTAASPKRLQLVYEKGVIHTPEPVANVEVPSTVQVLGQSVDVSGVKQALEPAGERVAGAFTSIADILAQTPGLQLPADGFTTWQLNTVVDEDTRIVRSDGGAVSIFARVVPPAPPAKKSA